jgi:hypothetical protein
MSKSKSKSKNQNQCCQRYYVDVTVNVKVNEEIFMSGSTSEVKSKLTAKKDMLNSNQCQKR